MPIKSYTPPKLKLVDNRSPDGGFYTANCDVCNTEYYPKRSNAKYCSPKCGVVAHRMEMAKGGKVKKKETKKPQNAVTVKGKYELVGWMESKGVRTRGLLTMAKEQEFVWEGYKISRLNSVIYSITETHN